LRFLDVAASVMVGLVVLSYVSLWNPQTFADNTARFRVQTELRSKLLGLVMEKGLNWFSVSSAAQVCSFLRSVSNSTVAFSASVGGADCGGKAGAVEAELPLHLSRREVVLNAWLEAG
jgi:hypothetical protein